MFDISFLDLSAGIGLFACVLLTLNILMGMLLGTAYKRSVYWQKLPGLIREVNLDSLHTWTGWLVLLLVSLHPFFLFLYKESKFSLLDIFFPLHAPNQRLFVLFGTVSFYALLLVTITSWNTLKKKMSFRFWKNIHLVSYGTALLFIVHGLIMDPELKNRPTDWLDAEKVLVESCFLVLVIASYLRIRYHLKKPKVNKPILV